MAFGALFSTEALHHVARKASNQATPATVAAKRKALKVSTAKSQYSTVLASQELCRASASSTQKKKSGREDLMP